MKISLPAAISAFILLAACTPAISPTPSPQPTQTPIPVEIEEIRCCGVADMAEGRYRLPEILGVDITFAVTGEWRSLNEQFKNFFAIIRGENASGKANQWIQFMLLQNTTEEQFQADILAAPYWEILSGPEEITLGSFSGWVIETQAKLSDYPGQPGGRVAGSQETPVFEDLYVDYSYTYSAQAFTRIYALDVEDRILVIALECDPAEWDQFLIDVQPILDSLAPL